MAQESTEALVTVVIPLFNEESIISAVIDRISRIRSAHTKIQWLFVDDGSEDDSVRVLRASASRLSHWKIVTLANNAGQQQAYRAGLAHADGQAVIFLDADLQDPPELIPEMIDRWRSGAMLVIPRRRSRKERGHHRWKFALFHWVFFHMTDGVMPRNTGTFGLMDRTIVDRLNAMQEYSVFLQALRCWVGHSPVFLWYDREERMGGKAKQNIQRLVRQGWDALTSFSETPLHMISYAGMIVSLLSGLYVIVLIAMKILQMFGYLQSLIVQGFTTIAVAISFLGGIQLIAIGILGEYIARIYLEVKRRPPYTVESISSSDATNSAV
jgi:dolichol-phosphate mannosyltransferase